jgi:hypothetical protein
MKLTKMAFAAAVAWGIYAHSAHAQQPQMQPAAYTDYYFQEGAASPSDLAPAMPHGPMQADKMIQSPIQGKFADEVAECEPWRLFCQKECGWNIYGFVAAGAATNDDSSFFNGPTTFADHSDFYMNQLYWITEKNTCNDGCGWGWGGRMDILYGSDYIFTQATGLELRDDGSQHWNSDTYGVAIPQLYGEVAYNNLGVKVGHFYTPIGYEVVPATGNFFYTHAYTMQYGEPFTHTGALATWSRTEGNSLVLGFVNGWDHFDRQNDTGALIAGFTWTNGCRLSASLMGIMSPNEPKNALITDQLQTNRDMYSLVLNFQATERLQYVFQHDMGYQRDGSVFTDGATSAEWYGINQYLFYTINDCWKAGARFEWFRDDDGARVGGVRPGNPLSPGGFAGNFYDIALGLNWTPHANVLVRPEVRWDWYDGDILAGANGPFDTDNFPGDDEQMLAALDVIFLW